MLPIAENCFADARLLVAYSIDITNSFCLSAKAICSSVNLNLRMPKSTKNVINIIDNSTFK